jgi:hypothetical protein
LLKFNHSDIFNRDKKSFDDYDINSKLWLYLPLVK